MTVLLSFPSLISVVVELVALAGVRTSADTATVGTVSPNSTYGHGSIKGASGVIFSCAFAPPAELGEKTGRTGAGYPCL